MSDGQHVFIEYARVKGAKADLVKGEVQVTLGMTLADGLSVAKTLQVMAELEMPVSVTVLSRQGMMDFGGGKPAAEQPAPEPEPRPEDLPGDGLSDGGRPDNDPGVEPAWVQLENTESRLIAAPSEN